MDVSLYIYDLSQGLASNLSLSLLGIQLDAIYHTSLVLDGVEYFFGRGIQAVSPPGCCPQYGGPPMEIMPLGETEIPMEVVREFLDQMNEEYHPGSYNIMTRNCNHFTNEFAEFLLGTGIPRHIVNLPETVMDRPLGQMLLQRMNEVMINDVNQ